jgi:hypothetical protein
VHGPLSDAIGRRPVMIAGMSLYTVGSIACMLAPNYHALIAARMLQGATAGVGVVIGRAVIRDLYEGPRAQHLMSVTTMIFAIAPAIAPIIGGWAHVGFGWRAVFAVMVVCGILFAFSAWWKLPETHPPSARIPFNARNLVATSWTVLRHREFLMLAIAADDHTHARRGALEHARGDERVVVGRQHAGDGTHRVQRHAGDHHRAAADGVRQRPVHERRERERHHVRRDDLLELPGVDLQRGFHGVEGREERIDGERAHHRQPAEQHGEHRVAWELVLQDPRPNYPAAANAGTPRGRGRSRAVRRAPSRR